MALPAQAHGFLIDLDGTVLDGPYLVSGVPEALAFLQTRNLAYRVVTNTTIKPRSAILTNWKNRTSVPTAFWIPWPASPTYSVSKLE